MPLRDHFRPPLASSWSPEGILPGWPAMIVRGLNAVVPGDYGFGLRVHRQGSEKGISDLLCGPVDAQTADSPVSTLDVPSGEIDQDMFEVWIHDNHREPSAILGLVSPATKVRPAARRAFVAKYATRLREGVSIAIVDLVTTDSHNLYRDLLSAFGLNDPSIPEVPWPMYAVSCRCRREPRADRFQAWSYPLAVGQPLPTLPLWVTDTLAVPLDLEATYGRRAGSSGSIDRPKRSQKPVRRTSSSFKPPLFRPVTLFRDGV